MFYPLYLSLSHMLQHTQFRILVFLKVLFLFFTDKINFLTDPPAAHFPPVHFFVIAGDPFDHHSVLESLRAQHDLWEVNWGKPG